MHALQLGPLVSRYDAVDLAVRVYVMLSGIFLIRIRRLALHVDGRHGKESGLKARQGELATAVSGSVELNLAGPVVLQTLLGQSAEVFVVLVAWAVGGV